ncbi:MAG: hypothetical protein ACK5T6_04335 [Pirellula sp.]|jgi:hypothetical protein
MLFRKWGGGEVWEDDSGPFLDASLMASVKPVLVVAEHVKAEQKSSMAERSNAEKWVAYFSAFDFSALIRTV